MTKKEKNNSTGAKKGVLSKISVGQRTLLILLTCASIAALITYILYAYTQELLKERLQERLTAIAATSATVFDTSDIQLIRGPEDMESDAYVRIVDQLNDIRDANENIQYAYLMRRTQDPMVVEFVADADSLSSLEELDANENGELDPDEEPPYPGDPYEVDDYPVLKDEAFYHPSVDRELQPDQWGLLMAAYAPIFDDGGEAVAIIGIDVLVDDFQTKTQAMLLPFLLFILFLVFLLTLLTLLLVRFYGALVEALKEIDRQKDELLSIVSHQLATPISSVKWYLEMMADGDVGAITKEQKQHIDTIQSVAVNLVDLVGMILDVSRIQLGRMKIDKTDLNLSEFFKEIINVIEPKAKEKNVNLITKIPDKLPMGYLDQRLMRMTVENLLSNAVKYTPEKGNVELLVELRRGTLHCEVKDTGCGIPESDKDKIFGKLFRASNVRNVNGNGFGLYIAKGAIEAHRGKIWFESKEGQGTNFIFEVPVNDRQTNQEE